MPKVVDHAERRAQISEAMWTILRRDGIHAVTVRSIAAESGRSVGAIRHYFKSQDELLLFAMHEMVVSIARRIGTIDFAKADASTLSAALEEMLPLDGQRRAEAHVWFAVLSRGQVSEQVAGSVRELDAVVRNAVYQVLTELSKVGAVDPTCDISVETDRLHALIDGLSLHGLSDPPVASPATIRAVLHRHLEQLMPPRSTK